MLGGRCVAFREVRRNYTTLQPWPFELRCKPPTLSSTTSFGSGSWYTTEKDPARAIPFKTFRCDVDGRCVAFREVRRNYTTLQPWPFELQRKRFNAFCTSFQVAGILRILQEPYHSRPFVDVEAVVAFREVRRNYTTLQPWPFELRCHRRFQVLRFGSGSWYTTERILQHTPSRPFVVMLRRSLCCFS
jgi:hypothetical protein